MMASNIFDILDPTLTGAAQDLAPTNESYTGLPPNYREKLLGNIMPQLTQATQNMPYQINQFYDQAMGGYRQQLNNALKTNIPMAVNNLSNRGVLDSTVASNTLGNVTGAAMQDFSTKGYQAAMQKAQMQSQLPAMLSQIAGLGSSTTSRYRDPTALLKIITDLLGDI